MVEVYVSAIVRGLKQFKDVPATLKTQVKQMLVNLGLEELAQ